MKFVVLRATTIDDTSVSVSVFQKDFPLFVDSVFASQTVCLRCCEIVFMQIIEFVFLGQRTRLIQPKSLECLCNH